VTTPIRSNQEVQVQPIIPFIPWDWRDNSWLSPYPDGRDDRTDATPTDHRPDTGLVGYGVEATDGSIGSIDERNAEVPTDCLLVDTGPWIFGTKVVLPVGTVRHVDHENRKVLVDRTKDQVKAAPEYDPDADGDTYRQRLGDYYSDSYRTAPPA
jgi:hypothetical protein